MVGSIQCLGVKVEVDPPTASWKKIAHFHYVARAASLCAIIYNNPVAYGIDLRPPLLAELADEACFTAIKESSADLRRITDIHTLLGDRYEILTGSTISPSSDSCSAAAAGSLTRSAPSPGRPSRSTGWSRKAASRTPARSIAGSCRCSTSISR
jgi:hypothetical protein